MKKLLIPFVTVGLAAAQPVFASGSGSDVRSAIQSASDFGLTHFESIEFDDDYGDGDRIEVEGWLDDGWYVELDMADDGTVTREDRRKRSNGPRGLSADEMLEYVNVSEQLGMARFDEIDVDDRGYLDIEGNEDGGRELEIDFRTGSFEPVRVERDDR